jgi:diguanylate cyclase (GGDEF)-like protein/PAS domain S-box-containing protein
MLHRQGHAVPVLVRGFVTRDANGRAIRVSGTNMDITERVQALQMNTLRSDMLERLSSDLPLAPLLREFARQMEQALPGTRCSIDLQDQEQNSTQGETSAPQPGRREPIYSGTNTLLGHFQVTRGSLETASPHEVALLQMAAHIAGIAIERKRAEMQLQLSSAVFEQGNEIIMITDARARMVRVNKAFTKITGYSESEALGRNPSMLSSGRQDSTFYKSMWKALLAQGHWQGEVWNRRKDGSVYPEWLSISPVYDAAGALTHFVAIGADITQRKQDEERIRQLADFDPLTALPNRRLLQDRVNTALSHAQRQNEPLALMFLDLDRFKNVNDSLGHQMGDALLIEVARRLTGVLRDQDTVCRLGGDEFVMLCPATDATGAAHLAEKLLLAIAQRHLILGQEIAITSSIGIAMYPADGDSFEVLSMRADTAMYRAKQSGRNAFCFFTFEMQQLSARTLQLENGLRRALELNQLYLVYQPQIDIQTRAVVGVEALVRWNHPTLGTVSPTEFIPVAEDSGLILSIGEWVLRTATRQLQTWQSAGLPLQQVAVNLSAVQFKNTKLPHVVTQILEECGLPARCLELELTEGVAMNDAQGAIEIMHNLGQRGVRMSIDDFGTGYSSLSYLKRFHVYKLKIDQSFVRDITDDPEDRGIVVAIIQLAKSLGFLTIAEGVETEGQLAFLREHGCDEVQGYFYSRPLLPDALEAFVVQTIATNSQ